MTATVIADRFLLETPAAAGGMGTVYRGRDQVSAEPVAIKILHGSSAADRERFAREARILAGLSHPGIVAYVAHGQLDDGRSYLVMRWIDGETLDARLSGAGVTLAESLTVVRRAADALGHAHALGLVHRDVKPSNLIFPRSDVNRTIVLDFGIARSTALPGSLTETGAVVGTPSYMAPEQARGERDLDARVDVFALGCVLYECVTGRLAFEGKRFLALTAKIVLWDPPPPRALNADVPAELDELITAMLAKDPAARPADGAAVAARLAQIPVDRLRGGMRRHRQPSPPTTVVRRAPSSSPGTRRLTALVVAAAPETAGAGATLTLDGVGRQLESLGALVQPFGARIDVLGDGSVIAVLEAGSTPLELAVRAARCGLALRAALPDALIGVTCAELGGGGTLAGDDAGLLFERTASDLARDAMAAVFAHLGGNAPPPGSIRIDERTAALLERDHPVIRSKGGIYLQGALP